MNVLYASSLILSKFFCIANMLELLYCRHLKVRENCLHTLDMPILNEIFFQVKAVAVQIQKWLGSQ